MTTFHLTKVSTQEYTHNHIINGTFYRSDLMEPKYKIGQRVIAKLVKSQALSARSSGIEQYAGQSGIVTDFYWIRPSAGEVFFIYTVKMGESQEEIVLYEDEMQAD